MLYPLFALHLGEEYHLGAAVHAEQLERLEVAHLHGDLGVEHVGGLPHELGRLDVGLGEDEFAFGEPALLGGAGEGLLEVLAELDVLDEDVLDLA